MEKLYVEQRDGKYRFILRFHDPKTGKVKRIVTTKDKYSKQIYNDALRELLDGMNTFSFDKICMV